MEISSEKLPYDICVILVGLGAPASLYFQLTENLRLQLPYMKFHLINWWDSKDFGKKILDGTIHNTRAIVIAHSGGGVIAMQALVQSPHLIKRVIMLDTHALHDLKSLPTVENMLEVMLRKDNDEVKNLVVKAYQPVINNDVSFYASFRFALNWASSKLSETGAIIKNMPTHTVLHIGFTDSNYQILDREHDIEQCKSWTQYNIDHQCMPMNHFDLVIPEIAKSIAQDIARWLSFNK